MDLYDLTSGASRPGFLSRGVIRPISGLKRSGERTRVRREIKEMSKKKCNYIETTAALEKEQAKGPSL
jgi:hypothetical protein